MGRGMNAAVCMTGYLRTFWVPSVYQSIEAVRKSLNAPLFAVVSNDDGDTFRGQVDALDDVALAPARAHVNILDWRIVPRADQYVKLAYCAAMLHAHERRIRKRALWVVRVRPDGLYFPFPKHWLSTLNKTTVYQSSNSGDVMWVIPRGALTTMAAIGGTPLSTSPGGDICCADLPHRYFECGCEIVRTTTASATIAKVGLFPTRDLGNRLDNPAKQKWAMSLPTTRLAHWPGTAHGVTIKSLHRRPNASASRAYMLLDRKPWAAG
jgi:hypothetical protein